MKELIEIRKRNEQRMRKMFSEPERIVSAVGDIDWLLAEISGLESDLREADAALQCEYPWRHCKLTTEQTRQRKCVSCLTKIAIRERRPQLFMEESD